MAALDFPASPTVGQQATLTNGFTYQWDGAVWTLAASTGQQAGGDLTGTYPNPTLVPAQKNLWQVPSANMLGPVNTAVTDLVWGPGTVKTHLSANSTGFYATVNNPWAPDDLTKTSWTHYLDADVFAVERRAANTAAGTRTNLMLLDAYGTLTLPGDTASQAVVTMGTQTAKTRLHAANQTGSWAAWSLNTNTYTGTRDDTSKVAWEVLLRNDLDQFQVRRRDTAGTLTTPLTIESGGQYVYLGNVSPRPMIQAYNGSMAMHANFAWGPDNPAMPSWTLYARPDTDQFVVYRRAPNAAAGTVSAPLVVDGPTGKTFCTLSDGSVAKGMLGAGAAYRNYWVGAIPNSFNSNNQVNTFVTIASCPVNLSGGIVLLLGHYGLQYSGATNVAVYLAYFCDGAQLGISKWVPGASSGGILVFPLPCVSSLDAGRPAGAHTYYLKCYVVSSTSANITSATDQVGAFYVVELS